VDEPTASGIQFTNPDPNAPGGPWKLVVIVTGSGFLERGLPLTASVGSVPVQGIFTNPDGSGFSGLLATTPNDGDSLSVGYEVVASTDLVFHPNAVA
jgi:hypothetical protein